MPDELVIAENVFVLEIEPDLEAAEVRTAEIVNVVEQVVSIVSAGEQGPPGVPGASGSGGAMIFGLIGL